MMIDCSGSMGEEIASVLANAQRFVETMESRGANYRIGGVLYGSIIYDTLHPTSDFGRFREFVSGAQAIGGDEISSLAIKAATEMNFRPNSQRVFIMITDDWVLQDNSTLSEFDLTQMLWDARARLYTIGNPCMNNNAITTRLTLGREYDITAPFNSILDEIGSDITTIYQLVYESKVPEPKVTMLMGRVRDDAGRPAAVALTFTAPSGEKVTVQTNQTTGEYETPVREGIRYEASINGQRFLPLAETVDLGALKQGDTATRDFTLRTKPTTLAGRVTDENGNPVQGEVRIDDATTLERTTTVPTNSDGRYTTEIKEGKTYRITAAAPDHVPTFVEVDTRNVEQGSDLTQDLNVMSIDAAIASGTAFKLKNLFFDYDKWDVKPESMPELNRLADLLKEYPVIKVEIGAHTDARGGDQYNLDLSTKRARSVMDYLIGRGIARERLSSKGYGETVPVASNDSEEGRALNRRVEFKLLK
jgi:outer membrane protein OmpA-like peptidoglycan-associated protein